VALARRGSAAVAYARRYLCSVKRRQPFFLFSDSTTQRNPSPSASSSGQYAIRARPASICASKPIALGWRSVTSATTPFEFLPSEVKD